MPAVDPSVLASIPPGVDPSDYLAQMRKQRIADFLTQDSLSPVNIQQPQSGVGGKYVEARVSPLSGLAKLAEAVMGRNAADGSNRMAAQNYAKGLQSFGQPQPPPAPTASDTMPSSPAPAGAGPSPTTGAPASAASATSNLNPMGLPPQLAMRMYMQKPEEYGKLLAGPDAWQMALRANGGDTSRAMAYVLQTPEYRTKLAEYGGDATALAQATQAAATKAGTITMRQGEDARIPDGRGGYTDYRNPTLPTGVVLDRDAAGNPTAAHLLPGVPQAEARVKGAVTAAEAANTPHEVPTTSGAPAFLTPGQANSASGITPPGGASGAPGGRQYFPPSTPGLQTTAGKESQTEGGKNTAEFGSNLADDSNGALEVRRSLAEMKNLAKQNTPSAANGLKMKIAQFAIASGVSPETIQSSLGIDAGALEAAKKQTSGLAVASIHQMTTRGTNFDLQTFMENNPNLLQTPGGFRRVIDYMDGKSKSIIEKQREYHNFDPEGKIPADQKKGAFTAYWNEKQEKEIESGKYNSAVPKGLPTKQIAGVTYEQLGPGQWRVKQ